MPALAARNRSRRWILCGAGAVILLLCADLLVTATVLTPSTSSLIASVKLPCATAQPQLRLLSCAPGCERHRVCDRAASAPLW